MRPKAATALVFAALAAWLLVAARMRGMDDGPGTDLGDAGWYLGIWVTMMAAMMLPVGGADGAPLLAGSRRSRRGARASRRRSSWPATSSPGRPSGSSPMGSSASCAARPRLPRLGPGRARVAGAAVALAGVYQLTPLKRVCLRNCRTPLGLRPHHWRAGPLGARADGSRARGLVRRLLLGADARALRGRRHEHHVDARRGGGDLRGEGAPRRRAGRARRSPSPSSRSGSGSLSRRRAFPA